MAGIAGFVRPLEFDSKSLIGRIAASLCFSDRSKVESWCNSEAGLCRVRVGADNPESQPIFARDGTKCIIMFGECFSYEEHKRRLLREGYPFAFDNNDAEFCLGLYSKYGDGAFSQLSGSFCLAIYELEKKELLLVSDRLGSRPLFYGKTADDKLIFSTQVSSVLIDSGVDRDLHLEAVVEFCTLQRVLGEKTYHRGVQMLPPASMLRYRAGRIDIGPYWYPDYKEEPGTVDDYADELAAVMKRVLEHISYDDRRVAMLLSGGLDARMAVAATGKKLICYTFGDYENPEADVASQIAQAGGCEFRFLRRDSEHYARVVDTAVEIGNGMHPFNHAHALGFIDAIAQECDVVTHGFVPELLFRGYSLPKVPEKIFGVTVGSTLDPTLTKENLTQRLYRRGYSLLDKGVENLFAPRVRETTEELLRESARKVIGYAHGHAQDVYDMFLWPDVYYHSRYPSMLFELALRPFMTERSLVFHNEVLDLHLRMPVRLRADNKVWVKALARLNKRIADVADANSGHSPSTPVWFISLLEVGERSLWSTPGLWRLMRKIRSADAAPTGLSPHSWSRFDWMIRNNQSLRQLISKTLLDSAALPTEIFDRARVQELFEEHLSNKGQHRVILFALLTFARWHKKYGCH